MQWLAVICSNMIALDTKLFTSVSEHMIVNRLTPKNHLKSFSVAFERHKTSVNFFARAYFWQVPLLIGVAFWSFPGITWKEQDAASKRTW